MQNYQKSLVPFLIFLSYHALQSYVPGKEQNWQLLLFSTMEVHFQFDLNQTYGPYNGQNLHILLS